MDTLCRMRGFSLVLSANFTVLKKPNGRPRHTDRLLFTNVVRSTFSKTIDADKNDCVHRNICVQKSNCTQNDCRFQNPLRNPLEKCRWVANIHSAKIFVINCHIKRYTLILFIWGNETNFGIVDDFVR